MSEEKAKSPKQVNVVFVVLATALFASLVTLGVTTWVINDDPKLVEYNEEEQRRDEAQNELNETASLLADPIDDQISAAQAEIDEASTAREKSDAYLKLGSIYLNQPDFEKAQINLDRAYAEDPENQSAVNALYGLAAEQDDVAAQVKWINVIIGQLDTEDPLYNANKADLESELERLENEN